MTFSPSITGLVSVSCLIATVLWTLLLLLYVISSLYLFLFPPSISPILPPSISLFLFLSLSPLPPSPSLWGNCLRHNAMQSRAVVAPAASAAAPIFCVRPSVHPPQEELQCSVRMISECVSGCWSSYVQRWASVLVLCDTHSHSRLGVSCARADTTSGRVVRHDCPLALQERILWPLAEVTSEPTK